MDMKEEILSKDDTRDRNAWKGIRTTTPKLGKGAEEEEKKEEDFSRGNRTIIYRIQ